MTDTSIRTAPAIHLIQHHPAARVLALTTLFAALTALGAQAAILLPFTPVPVTLQVLFVLLSGVALGSRLGALSQLQYLAMGAAGLPVFAGGAAGLVAFAGPSGGYLPGFVAAAWLVGLLTERMRRPSLARMLLAMGAGIAAIYLPGVVWLSLWLRLVDGAVWGSALQNALLLGAVPFLGADLVKAAVVAGISARLHRSS